MRFGGKGGSPGDLSLLFHIVKVVALVLFRSQDVAPPINKLRLIGKLSLQRYVQLHVLSLDWFTNLMCPAIFWILTIVCLSSLRILAIYMVLKPLKIRPPWCVLLDYFTTRPSFKNLYQAKRTRGVWFLVVFAPCIASILKSAVRHLHR